MRALVILSSLGDLVTVTQSSALTRELCLDGLDLGKDSSICLTLDTDWAHEVCIADVLELLNRYNVKATFFATNLPYTCLCETSSTEVGIHPNFNKILAGDGGSIKDIIDELLGFYPRARGLRSHSLTSSSAILNYSKERGLIYDSNLYNPNQAMSYLDYSGLIRFTLFWSDYGMLMDAIPLTLAGIPFKPQADNILIFHPIHIYLNTPNIPFYHSIKHQVHDYSIIKDFRNTEQRGVRDLFIDLLECCHIHSVSTRTLSNMCKI